MTPYPTRAEFKAVLGIIQTQAARIAEIERRTKPVPKRIPVKERLPVTVLHEREGRSILEALIMMAAQDTAMTPADIKSRKDRLAAHVRQWVYLEAHAKGVSLSFVAGCVSYAIKNSGLTAKQGGACSHILQAIWADFQAGILVCQNASPPHQIQTDTQGRPH